MRPNENNLGGALEINDHYLQMTKKIANVKSTVSRPPRQLLHRRARIRVSRQHITANGIGGRAEAAAARLLHAPTLCGMCLWIVSTELTASTRPRPLTPPHCRSLR